MVYMLCAGRNYFDFVSQKAVLPIVEELKIFLILIVFPLFLSETGDKSGFSVSAVLNRLAGFALLAVIFMPLSVAGALLGAYPFGTVLIVHLLMLFIWLVMMAVVNGDSSGNRIRRYYLAVFAVCGGFPLSYYLLAEFYGVGPAVLLYLNPFWLVARILG